MKLFLVRHGETYENASGIIQGWYEAKLNELGLQQAREAAEQINEDVIAIYSSDLLRCKQTAQFFKDKYSGVPYHEDSRIRERNFGDAQNTPSKDHDWEVFWAAYDTVSIPNAETLQHFDARVEDFLNDVSSKHAPNSKILVITHGGTINRILNLLKLSTTHRRLENCEVLEVDL